MTTDDISLPNDARKPRRLRIPNREVAQVYRGEVADRAQRGLDQALAHNYAQGLPGNGAIAWSIGFYKKDCAVVCERVPG